MTFIVTGNIDETNIFIISPPYMQTLYRGEHITLRQALGLVGVGTRDKKKHNYRLMPSRVSVILRALSQSFECFINVATEYHHDHEADLVDIPCVWTERATHCR